MCHGECGQKRIFFYEKKMTVFFLLPSQKKAPSYNTYITVKTMTHNEKEKKKE